MRLKLDENLGLRGADLFLAAGHDVATVLDEQLEGADDRQVISVCQTEKRCLVTLDLDFGNPLLFDPSEFSGIAVLRLPPKPTDTDLSLACRTLIGGLSTADITGRLWIVQRAKIREYRPEKSDEP